MQPAPEFRRFESKAGPDGPAPAVVASLDLPEEGKGVVLNRPLPCPRCSRTEDLGGHVHLQAILWVDDWPVTTPEAGQPVLEYPEKVCRTLHVAIAPTGLQEQPACSAGHVLEPGEWEDAERAAFLDLCRTYTQEVDRLKRALRRGAP